MLLTGALAQLVEQRTENPCVPGSIPGGTTYSLNILFRLFVFLNVFIDPLKKHGAFLKIVVKQKFALVGIKRNLRFSHL